MEKRLSSVSSLMLGHVGPRNTEVSHGFSHLVKNIRRSTSAMELDDVINKELDLLRQKLSQPDMGEKKTKELLVRLIYCEMLGHSASFGHITALKMAQQGSLQLKRVGYLAASLFLDPTHELLLLLVNTVQKDLKSTSILDNCMALTAVANLFGPDMIPAVLHQVMEKMKHNSAMVRKKAVMTIYAFLEKTPHLTHHMTDKFKEALCDREPSVMGAALHIYSKLVMRNPSGHQSLVRPLVNILMQVSSHKLPVTFEFHGVPAPWLQIRTLKMLARLGHDNEYASNLMYDVLEQIMKKLSLRQTISYAVHYECISTIAAIYPNEELISLASKSVSRFLKSRDNDLKYLGIEALGQLLAVDPACGSAHQMVVVECLTDPDLTIRKKTLELLYLMANSSNIEVICEKFLECLPSLTDVASQQNLAQKVVQMACKHHQSLKWFLRTICDLCVLADWEIENLVLTTTEVIKQKRRSDGSSISATVMEAFLPYATGTISNEPLAQLTIWVLGEFCSQEISSLMVHDAFLHLLDIYTSDEMEWQTDTKMFILSALGKVYSKSDDDLEMNLRKNIETMLSDREPEIRQKAAELIVLSSSKHVQKQEMFSEIDASKCDWTLSFLDQFVSDALADGAPPYRPRQQRSVEETPVHSEVKPELFSGLNFQPYSAPPVLSHKSSSIVATNQENNSSMTPTKPDSSSVASAGSSEHRGEQCTDSSQLKLSGVEKVWGKSGYIKSDVPKAGTEPPSPQEGAVSPASPQDTKLPYHGPTGTGAAAVQLNLATAVGDGHVTSHVTRRDSSPVEEDDPDMKQKNLAQALFGNQPSEKVQSCDQSPDPHAAPQKETSLVDLLSMSSDTIDSEPMNPSKPGSNQQDRSLTSNEYNSLSNQLHGPSGPGKVVDYSSSLYQDKPAANRDTNPPTLSLDLLRTELSSTMGDSDLRRDESITSDDPSLQPEPARSSDSPEPHMPISSDAGLLHGRSVTNSGSLNSPAESDANLLHQSLDPLKSQAVAPASSVETDATAPSPSLLDGLSLDRGPDEAHSGHGIKEFEHRLPTEFHGFPSSRRFEQLCSDERVQISLCRVWKPEELGLVFFVNNKSPGHEIYSVQITANLPSSLKLCNTEDRKFSGTVSSVGAHGWKSLSLCCTCQSPSVNMPVGGEVTYRDHTNTSRRLFFNTAVVLTDILRQHLITTQEFGRLWSQPCHDVRTTIETATKDLKSIATCLSEELPVTIVDIKGNEALCGTTALQKSVCLVHFRKDQTKLNIWIKATDKMLRDAISKVILATLRKDS